MFDCQYVLSATFTEDAELHRWYLGRLICPLVEGMGWSLVEFRFFLEIINRGAITASELSLLGPKLTAKGQEQFVEAIHFARLERDFSALDEGMRDAINKWQGVHLLSILNERTHWARDN